MSALMCTQSLRDLWTLRELITTTVTRRTTTVAFGTHLPGPKTGLSENKMRVSGWQSITVTTKAKAQY